MRKRSFSSRSIRRAKSIDRQIVTAANDSNSDGVSIGGSVVFAEYANDVDAYIGAGASVDTAGDVLVDAQIVNPFPWEAMLNTVAEVVYGDFASIQDLLTTLATIYFTSPDTSVLLNSYVSNSSPGSKFGLSASFNMLDFST